MNNANANAAAPRFRVLGTTGDVTTCELCGKSELAKTVVLRNLATLELVHAGVDCAAAATARRASHVRAAAARANGAVFAVFTRIGVEVARFGRGKRRELEARLAAEPCPATWSVAPVGGAS